MRYRLGASAWVRRWENYAEAARWYSNGAHQGNAAPANNRARLYYMSKGVRYCYPDALAWFSKAAHRGFTVAQYALGFMYRRGIEQPSGRPLRTNRCNRAW